MHPQKTKRPKKLLNNLRTIPPALLLTITAAVVGKVLTEGLENTFTTLPEKTQIIAILVISILVVIYTLYLQHSFSSQNGELEKRKRIVSAALRCYRHIYNCGIGFRHGTTLNRDKINAKQIVSVFNEYETEVIARLEDFNRQISHVVGLDSVPVTASGLYFWISTKPPICNSDRCHYGTPPEPHEPLKEYRMRSPGYEDISLDYASRNLQSPPPGLSALANGPFDIFDSYYLIFTTKPITDFTHLDYENLDHASPKLIVFNCGQHDSILPRAKKITNELDTFEIHDANKIINNIKLIAPDLGDDTELNHGQFYSRVDAMESSIVAQDTSSLDKHRSLNKRLKNLFCDAFKAQNTVGSDYAPIKSMIDWLEHAIERENLAIVSLTSLIGTRVTTTHAAPETVYCYYKIVRKSTDNPSGYYLVSSRQIDSIQTALLGAVYANVIQQAEAEHDWHIRFPSSASA